MQPRDTPVAGPKNDPLMPVAWTKGYETDSGKVGRVFTTTMGAATDLVSEGLRRLLVNAAYWCVGLEQKVPERANVDLVGEFQPTEYGFKGAKRGVKPADHAL
jgi:type 1 glutamine amidotransferase